MTVCESGVERAAERERAAAEAAVVPDGLPGLVLAGLGVPGASGAGGLPPLPRVATSLAQHLSQTSRTALTVQPIEPQATPDQALAALGRGEPGGGWLAPLPVDVGLPLADGSCWAQALGAWRQPTLLVMAQPQLPTGLAAAATALLRQWQVPLLGLLQWGGLWDQQARRADGLPWLGLLPDDSSPQSEALLAACTAQAPLAEQQQLAELGLAAAIALAMPRLRAR